MDSNDELRNELLIGYDLCNDYSQISYFNFAQKEPKTISTAAGEEKFQIPTVLLKKAGIDKWYFGEEALKKADLDKQDMLIQNLLEKCSNQELVLIDEKEYEPAQLLTIFIKKSFGFLFFEGITSKVPDAIVFTVEHINTNIAKALKQSAKALGIPESNVYIQDHQESFVEYTIHQKNELWNHQVILLDYDKNYLKGYKLNINTKTTPLTCSVTAENFYHIKPIASMLLEEEDKEKELDLLVKKELKNYFGMEPISCIFLCGEGFDGDWPKETLRFLCMGRRVFQGKNLYTKGACYYAAKKLQKYEVEEYLFLGTNKLKYNIGIEAFDKGEKMYYSLLDANENWYDATKQCEFILDDECMVELKLTPVDHKDTRTVIINLHDLPQRPNRTVRILLEIKFESINKALVVIKDLGFGEIFETSKKVWNHEIFL